MWLGTWQLGRYNDKIGVEELAEKRSAELPIQIFSAHGLEKRSLRKTKPVGTFGSETHIIKHRIRNGKSGYWVLRPFTFSDGSKIIVNIGWYPKLKSEHFGKTLASPKEGWVGLVHVLDRNIADEAGRNENCDDCVWESFDVVGINKKILGKDSMLLLVAGENQTQGQYPVASFKHVVEPYMTADKHMGYALTWYGLGAGLVLLFLGAGFGLLGRR